MQLSGSDTPHMIFKGKYSLMTHSITEKLVPLTTTRHSQLLHHCHKNQDLCLLHH